ncbi:hypothetical protein DVDV_2037 [Desulfovibrio sp. DV]|nr:hypothetical protein DVDV_2037 [Desulfovibrio sp. DV]
MWSANQLEDVIGTMISGDPENRLDHIFLLAIDAVVGTQGFGACQLADTAGYNHLGPMHFGDLDAEQRDTARTLDQHSFTGMYPTALDEREPSGNPGAG